MEQALSPSNLQSPFSSPAFQTLPITNQNNILLVSYALSQVQIVVLLRFMNMEPEEEIQEIPPIHSDDKAQVNVEVPEVREETSSNGEARSLKNWLLKLLFLIFTTFNFANLQVGPNSCNMQVEVALEYVNLQESPESVNLQVAKAQVNVANQFDEKGMIFKRNTLRKQHNSQRDDPKEPFPDLEELETPKVNVANQLDQRRLLYEKGMIFKRNTLRKQHNSQRDDPKELFPDLEELKTVLEVCVFNLPQPLSFIII